MKRIAIALLAGVAAVAGLGHAASAADLAIPPPPPPLPSWTGSIIGAHAGAAWQQTPDWKFNDPNGFFSTATSIKLATPRWEVSEVFKPATIGSLLQPGSPASRAISHGRRSPIIARPDHSFSAGL